MRRIGWRRLKRSMRLKKLTKKIVKKSRNAKKEWTGTIL